MDLQDIKIRITVIPLIKFCKVCGKPAKQTSFGMLCYQHYQKALYDYETTTYEGEATTLRR